MNSSSNSNLQPILFVRTPHLNKMRDPLHTQWNEHLAAKESAIADVDLAKLIDFSQMNEVFASYLDVIGLPVAIIDLNGLVLASSNWQRLCLEFHRSNPDTLSRCLESDVSLSKQVREGKDYALYRCRNGLTDCASPIVIEGKHIANLFIGQFFLSQPSISEFEARSTEFGFERGAYLQALSEVPIVDERKIPSIMKMLVGFAGQIAQQSLAEYRARTAYNEIENLVAQRTEELLAATQHADAVIENALDAIVRINAAGVITVWSGRAEQMFGWSRLEAVGRQLHEMIVPKAYREGYVASVQRFFTTEDGIVINKRVEVAAVHRNGKEFPIEVSIASVKTLQGYEATAFIRDITERHLIEEIKQAGESRYRDLFENMNEGYAHCKMIFEQNAPPDILYLDVNKNYERVSGLKNVIGKKMTEVMPRIRESNPEIFEIYTRVAMEGKPNRFEIYLKPLNRWFSVSTYCPQHGHFVAVLDNITERKLVEASLKLTQFANDKAPDQIVWANEQAQICYANEAACKASGYSRAELLEMTILDINPTFSSTTWQEHWEEVKHKHYVSCESSRKRKDGSIVPTEVFTQYVQSGNEEFIIGYSREITVRKKMENDLRAVARKLAVANLQVEEERVQLAGRVRERTAQLQYANHAKDSFLATMSHEIRTPLGGLLGMMSILGFSQLSKEQREILRAAQQSGNSLLRIVNDILDWSKIEAGKLEIAPSVATIATMFKNVAETYSQLASEKDLYLNTEIDSELSVAHLFDSLRVSQILNNFISNAIKFTERGGITLRAKKIAQQGNSETICFSVQDGGIGISAEQQQRLFMQYEQASAETARMYGGTGLGLAISRKLAGLMDGTLDVKSEEGVGSTFSLTMNLDIADSAAQATLRQQSDWDEGRNKVATSRLLHSEGRAIEVLVVDDHPLNRMLLKQQLHLLEVKADVVADGAEALSKFQTGHYDLIITDCHMPGIDGYELTRRIRTIEQQGVRHIPVIAWTANVLAEEESRCLATGMDDIMTKPTELDELRAMILKWVSTP